MEENKVAQMTKHTDSSRITDSGVSDNAQTRAREIRAIVAVLLLTLTGCIHPKLPPCTTNNQAVPLSQCRYFDLPGGQSYLCGVVPEGEQKYERCQGHADGATDVR